MAVWRKNRNAPVAMGRKLGTYTIASQEQNGATNREVELQVSNPATAYLKGRS